MSHRNGTELFFAFFYFGWLCCFNRLHVDYSVWEWIHVDFLAEHRRAWTPHKRKFNVFVFAECLFYAIWMALVCSHVHILFKTLSISSFSVRSEPNFLVRNRCSTVNGFAPEQLSDAPPTQTPATHRCLQTECDAMWHVAYIIHNHLNIFAVQRYRLPSFKFQALVNYSKYTHLCVIEYLFRTDEMHEYWIESHDTHTQIHTQALLDTSTCTAFN